MKLIALVPVKRACRKSPSYQRSTEVAPLANRRFERTDECQFNAPTSIYKGGRRFSVIPKDVRFTSVRTSVPRRTGRASQMPGSSVHFGSTSM